LDIKLVGFLFSVMLQITEDLSAGEVLPGNTKIRKSGRFKKWVVFQFGFIFLINADF